MAGTKNEGVLFINSNTAKNFNIPEDHEIKNWYGVNKTEVLKHFLNMEKMILCCRDASK